MFIELNKTTGKSGHRKRKISQERMKSYVLKQMNFSANDENLMASKYFDLRISVVWRFRKVNSYLRMAK
jgi:carbonic anhydrase